MVIISGVIIEVSLQEIKAPTWCSREASGRCLAKGKNRGCSHTTPNSSVDNGDVEFSFVFPSSSPSSPS